MVIKEKLRSSVDRKATGDPTKYLRYGALISSPFREHGVQAIDRQSPQAGAQWAVEAGPYTHCYGRHCSPPPIKRNMLKSWSPVRRMCPHLEIG